MIDAESKKICDRKINTLASFDKNNIYSYFFSFILKCYQCQLKEKTRKGRSSEKLTSMLHHLLAAAAAAALSPAPDVRFPSAAPSEATTAAPTESCRDVPRYRIFRSVLRYFVGNACEK